MNLFCWAEDSGSFVPGLTSWHSEPVHRISWLSKWKLGRETERTTRRLLLLAWSVRPRPGTQLHPLIALLALLLGPPLPAGTTGGTGHREWGCSVLWSPLLLWPWKTLCEPHPGCPESTPGVHTRATTPATSGCLVLSAVAWQPACCSYLGCEDAFYCHCTNSASPDTYKQTEVNK